MRSIGVLLMVASWVLELLPFFVSSFTWEKPIPGPYVLVSGLIGFCLVLGSGPRRRRSAHFRRGRREKP
jgi:hypothetical protein